MRGDSIRDLYAKTLALLGLGVLAGTGALVDYWPSGVRLPVVESAFSHSPLSLALAAPEDVPLPDVRFAVAAAPVRRLAMESPTVFAGLMPGMQPIALGVPPREDFEADRPVRPAVLVPVAFDARNEMSPLGEEIPLSEPALAWADAPPPIPSAPVALSAADDHGMISDVMRATKTSLVITGRKTGASILGAFRVVSGAVRKALPN